MIARQPTYLLLGAGTLVQGLIPTFVAILAGTVVTAFGFAFVDGAQEAWASDEIGPERAGQTFARGAQVAQATSIVGILAATGLALVGLAVPIVAGAVCWLALGLVLAVAMPEHHYQRPTVRPTMRAQLRDGVAVVRTSPALLGILAMVVWFGALSISASVVAIGVTEVVRRTVTTDRPRRVARAVLAAQVAVVAGVATFALASPFWLVVVGFFAMTLGRSALGPMVSTWTVAHTAPATRATVFSITGQADAAGQILDGPPIGLVGERLSIRAGLLAAAALLTPAIGATAATLRREGGRR